RSPFGRPKWASSSTIAPRSASSVTVGRVARSRVSSLTAPSCIGTFRSTRTSARLPRTSLRSSRVRKLLTSLFLRHPQTHLVIPAKAGIQTDVGAALESAWIPAFAGMTEIGSDQLRHRSRGVDHAVRETPFIVVPGDDAHQLAFQHGGFEAVHARR